MKKLFTMSLLLSVMGVSSASANWWELQTVCRRDPSTCYTSMGIGYESGYWDPTHECWGQKYICGAALKTPQDDSKLMTKKQIASRDGINSDFDTDILNGDCFGVRKTMSNGSQATYNGNTVNVYCSGILENIYSDNLIENVATGSILKRNTQPSCKELSEYEYVNVRNGKCYGKRYAESEYYIDCSRGDNDVRLIILNGAEYTQPMGDTPTTMDAARDIFDHMVEISAKQRNK